MIQILISSESAILAFGEITEEGGQVFTPQGVFPIDVITGYSIIDVDLPADFAIGPAGAIWDGQHVVQNDVPEPTAGAPTRAQYEAAIQAELDDKARALFVWRDAVTLSSYQIINAVMSGGRPAMSVEELLELMPKLEL